VDSFRFTRQHYRLIAKEMAQTVADVLVGVLEQLEVKHIFGLIGDLLSPLADAVRRSRIQWVSVMKKELPSQLPVRPSETRVYTPPTELSRRSS
jgi:hypothetical protein